MKIDRRQFCSGVAASTASLMLPSAAHAEQSCTTPADTACRIIDASVNVGPKAKQIADTGIQTVIRFYTRLGNFDHGPYQNTALSQDELKALEDKQLAMATVFQYFSGGSGRTFHEPTKKIYDVRDALLYADKTKQPEHSTIYFGADFNLGPGDVGVIKEYFEHAQREVSKTNRQIGVYGCGRTCEILADENWDGMKYWISASTSYWHTAEFFNSDGWHLFQTRADIARPFGSIDTNITNPKYTSFGQWRSNGNAVAEPADISRRIRDARQFVTSRHTQLFSDPALSRPSDVLALFGRAVRVICRNGDATGISLDETEVLRGYCKASDLSPTMPKFD